MPDNKYRSTKKVDIRKETGIERQAFTVKEASVVLNISQKLTRDLIKEGKLKHVRAGNRILIGQKAIDKFLEGDEE